MYPYLTGHAIDLSRLNDEEGISLVELLIAIVLLAVIMGAMARSLTTSLLNTQAQERQAHATALVQELLEQAAGAGWERLGLCETPATTAFPTGTFTFPDGTSEDLVLLDDADPACTIATPAVQPLRPVQRSGVTYTARTVVSWSDDPLDDPSSGADPDPRDLKHIWVQLRWDTRGEQRELVTETYTAPDALEQVLTTLVEHDDPAAPNAGNWIGTFTYLDKDTGLTKTDVRLWAYAGRPQSAVHVRWRKANGSYITPVPMTPSADGLTFSHLIPNGSPDFDQNRLANGETLFEFSATDSVTTDVFTAFDRGLFLIEPAGVIAGSVTTSPTVAVDPNGQLCGPFDLAVPVTGLLQSDFVTASWDAAQTSLARRELTATEDTDPLSSLFDRTYATGTFAVPTGATAGSSWTINVSLFLERVADNLTRGDNPDVVGDEANAITKPVTVNLVEVC